MVKNNFQKKKIVITGSLGMLGQELLDKLKGNSSFEVYGVDLKDFDIRNKDQVYSSLKKIKPDIIIHTAAYTAVDKAEVEKEFCMDVNAKGTENLALFAKEFDAILCYFSTDFVFDGKKKEAYQETDEPNPINIYGLSKLEGEKAVIKNCKKYFILRISWLYGQHGKNFVYTMLELAKSKKEISVVVDQQGVPTWTNDIASNVLDVINTEKYGVYHFVGKEKCSWNEFATKIMDIKKTGTKILPALAKDMGRPAARPENSVLNSSKIDALLGRQVMPKWEESLERFLK